MSSALTRQSLSGLMVRRCLLNSAHTWPSTVLVTHVAGRRMRAWVSGRNSGSTPALGDCFVFLLLAESWTTHALCITNDLHSEQGREIDIGPLVSDIS